MQTFACLGAACPSPCCGKWSVGFTREETARLRERIEDDAITRAVKRARGADRSKVHASVVKDENGVCALWRGRCLLADYEDCLPFVCKSRPRVYARLGALRQAGIPAHCTGAARDFLFRQEPMQFMYVEEQETPGVYALQEDDAHADVTEAMRSFTIDVLQARHISLERRLYLLGTFYEALGENDDLFSLRMMIARQQKQLQADTGAGWKADPGRRVGILVWIIGGMCRQGSGEYAELFVPVAQALGFAQDDGDRLRTFYAAERRCIGEYLDEHEHVLEHFLVNEVFTRGLPGGSPSRQDAYLFIVMLYVMAKFHLVGLHAAQGSLSRDDVVKTLRLVLERHFTGERRVAEIGGFLRGGGCAELGNLSVLLCE
jgi:hypothetical protein